MMRESKLVLYFMLRLSYFCWSVLDKVCYIYWYFLLILSFSKVFVVCGDIVMKEISEVNICM